MTEKTEKTEKTARRARPRPAAPEAPAAPVVVRRSGLVAYNEGARCSESVALVQEVLRREDWRVSVDGIGYWGRYTEAAARAVTGKTDPVEVAVALGFAVV